MRQGIRVFFQSRIFASTVLVILFMVTSMPAQEPSPGQTAASGTTASQNAVPRLIQFGGVLKDHLGNPLTGVQGIAFNVYKDQSGGTSLWTEAQNATLDEQGRYTVMLGAMTTDGVPLDLFTSGESRWLGVQSQVQGETEQPRVLLVSVPYALKAADADTLGGQPLSAFVLADPQELEDSPAAGTGTLGHADPPGIFVIKHRFHPKDASLGGTSSTNSLAKWLDSTGDIGNSAVYESSGNVGIGTTSPGYNLHVKSGGITDIRSEGANYAVFSWKLDSGGTDQKAWQFFPQTVDNSLVLETLNDAENAAVPAMQIFRGTATAITSVTFPNGNVGIGTSSPGAKLDISTGADATKGLTVRDNSSTQSGNLQEWQDSSSNVLASIDPAGTFTGPLGMMLIHSSFAQAAGVDLGTASFLPSDTLMEAQTGTTASSIDDTVGGVLDVTNLSRTSTLIEGLGRKGAFLSARVRWNSATIASTHIFYVLAGGAESTSTASVPLLTSSASNGVYQGFGFCAYGNHLMGITTNHTTASNTGTCASPDSTTTTVDLSTTLTSGTFVELMAVRGASAVLFYVNGIYKASSTTNLPSTAASTYEVRTQNETSSATNAIAQVGFLTVGIPRP